MLKIDPQKTHAILIGAGEFDDTCLSPLSTIRNNLTRLIDLLSGPIGLDRNNNVHNLERFSFYNEIELKIDDIIPQATDTLIVYYAGHGINLLSDGFFLATSGTKITSNKAIGAIPATDFVRSIIKASKAKHTIFLIDCCYSHSACENIKFENKNVFFITAAERAAKSEALTDKRYTDFTNELLKILEHGIDSSQEILTFQTIFDCLKERLEGNKSSLPRMTNSSYISPNELGICKNQAYKNPSQSISPNEIIELQKILNSVNISDEQARESYDQLSDNSGLLDEIKQGDLFRYLLNHLAKRPCTPDGGAPLLEFLERCNPQIGGQVQAKLSAWKNKIASSLEIDLNAIRARIKPTCSSNQTAPILLIKIEPDLTNINKENFKAKAWFFKDNQSEQVNDISNQIYTRHDLEELISEISRQIVRNLSSQIAKDLIIEVILPLSLFDWNVNNLMIKVGPQQRPLCTRYPLAIRSLERLYHSNYDFSRQQWVDKWNACTACQPTDKTKYYWLCNENDYCETLFDELEDSAWFFLALTPMLSSRKQRHDIIGAMLAAGIPFAFWPLQEPESTEKLRKQIEDLLEQSPPENWLREIMQCRKQEIHKSEQLWHNINILQDNPNCLPPDIDYLLTPPE